MVTCGCERNAFGTIDKLCADHQFAEQRRCHGLIQRAEQLEAALKLFADAVYNDNGDVTVIHPGAGDYMRAKRLIAGR